MTTVLQKNLFIEQYRVQYLQCVALNPVTLYTALLLLFSDRPPLLK